MLRFLSFLLMGMLFAGQVFAHAQTQKHLPESDARSRQNQQRAPSSQAFSCSDYKTKCAQMRSCAEAQFFLKECGVLRLDRDRDGVACEALCR